MVATAHWAALKIACTLTATGVSIQLTTDAPCHLWMRWSWYYPHIHRIAIKLRGIYLRDDVRFCFVAYHDNEQAEPGDTLIHTFLKEPWPVCETRYFYFHGTIAGGPSPSTSGIFVYHRVQPPITTCFRPDRHPEVNSVDGYVRRYRYRVSWDDVHDGAGTQGYDTGNNIRVGFYCYKVDMWMEIDRGIILFPTATLPDNAIIKSAFVQIYCVGKTDPVGANPVLGLYESYPLLNTQIQPADYQLFHPTLLAPPMPYADIVVGSWNRFHLNPAGLAAINKVGSTKLGLREVTYDVADIEPPTGYYASTFMDFYEADHGDGSLAPMLCVTYEVP
ncbi:hypothetical protein ES703_116386 [subsurface metagenome]